MFNSICIAHRNRPKHLKLCLESLAIAAQQATKPIEIIITDLSDDEIYWEVGVCVPEIFLRNLKLDHKTYFSPLHKSKAINNCVCVSDGEYITILDADMIVQPQFFKTIEDFYSDASHRDTKLGHRCRLITSTHTDRCYRFGAYHFPTLRDQIFALHSTTYKDTLIGSGNFTIKAQNFVDLGGFDERFRGYGLEDTHFNLRCNNHYQTVVLEDNDIYHLFHKRELDWETPSIVKNNQTIFYADEAKGFPDITRPKEWGIFTFDQAMIDQAEAHHKEQEQRFADPAPEKPIESLPPEPAKIESVTRTGV